MPPSQFAAAFQSPEPFRFQPGVTVELFHQRSSLAPTTRREPSSAVAMMSFKPSWVRSATMNWLAALKLSLRTCMVQSPRGSPRFSNQTTLSPRDQAVAAMSTSPSRSRSLPTASKAYGNAPTACLVQDEPAASNFSYYATSCPCAGFGSRSVRMPNAMTTSGSPSRSMSTGWP